ncbi:type-1 restriction enzyme EcoKI specificity protein [Klebsiella sp. WP7-S18-CRE-02]|nr:MULTISPECIES: restriction endonuclease subunit S [unclassified Klebsiella]BBS93434.1 type-1 restriction enzyme EcoKI specificity protein [Klebsiella sp. WP7-S18-CRE-02]BBS98463.1 type-1 restriction enzyme EcoKI specificity protein [Klebsiella sp. WP7-S18-CRE-03]BBT03530.1 type-1 restriction enzyme EcoKI specificity protein [Klebsiella sp. WP7-S18-ESBL-04]HAT3951502.1 restriction endonuclease subunit S [Kluyvera ascorbata]
MKYLSSHPSWSKSSLEDIAIHIIGGDWGKDPEFSEEGYESVSCIRGSEFRSWKKNFGNTAVIRKVKASSLISRELIKNDILVEISGGGPDQPVGRTVLIDDRVLDNQVLPLVCTNFLRLVRLSPEVSASFINRYLEFFYSSGEVTKYQGGSNNLRNLKFKDYSKIEIPLPPLAEQKIIAEKLDTLLTQVGCTKARLEQILPILKHFRQATLTMAIKGDLTKNWRVENNIINAWTNQKASDLCIKVQSGSTPTGNPFEQNGKIPFLKVYNIVNQKIDFDYKPQFITDEVHRSKSKRSIAFPDDILMNIVGPPLGKIAILTDQYPEWNLNQAITLFRVDKEKLSSKFLYYVLCEGKLVRDVMHDTKGIVGQINISLTQCREAIIPCPSLLEQHEIVRRVEQLFAYADTIEKQVNSALTRVNSLTQSILAKAFRGELTAQWRAENPSLISGENSAAALLEKIKAERAASGGKKASRKKV